MNFIASTCLAALAFVADPGQDSNSFALRAARLHTGDGTVLEDAVVYVVDGRIRDVGRSVVLPPDVLVIEHDGDASTGLIALHDYSGARGENVDRTRGALPDAALVYALRPGHSDFQRLVREGVTTTVLAPHGSAFIGGQTAVVKTGTGRVLLDRAQMHLSFSNAALPTNREPTSYSGAIAELEALLAEPKGVFATVAAGRMPVLLEAAGKHEIMRAIAFAERHGLKGALLGASRAGELVGPIKRSGLAVVFRPFAPGMESRSLKSGKLLAEANVPFGFALDAPDRHPVSLRLGAAAFVREGLAPAAAWRALTSDAAKIAGVGNHVGRLAPGMDGDLVLWSGHPLDLGSRVMTVFVDGRKVYGGEEE